MENEMKEFMAKMSGEFQKNEMKLERERLALKEQESKEVSCGTYQGFLEALAR